MPTSEGDIKALQKLLVIFELIWHLDEGGWSNNKSPSLSKIPRSSSQKGAGNRNTNNNFYFLLLINIGLLSLPLAFSIILDKE